MSACVCKTLIAFNRRCRWWVSPINFNYKLFKNAHFFGCGILIYWLVKNITISVFPLSLDYACDSIGHEWWERTKKTLNIFRQIFPHQHVDSMVMKAKEKKIKENETGAYISHWKIIYFDVFAWKCFIISSFIACFYAVVKRNKHIFRKTLSKNDHRIIQVE